MPDLLLDHLIGSGQQRFRDGKAESFGGLKVDYELDLGRLHDRQVCRFQRLNSLSKACSSIASFFSGWRSTPGTMPATSQLD
jgi:hypothetical protein